MGFYLLDPFTGSDGAAWNATNWPTVRNLRSDLPPLPVVHSNKGRMAMPAGDVRQGAFTATDVADFDLKVKVTFILPTSPPNMYPEIGYRIGTNITSGAPADGYVLGIFPHAQGVRATKINSYDYIATRNDVPMADGLERYFRIRVKGDNHKYKWWLVTDPEPPSWGLEFTDASYATGRFMLGCWSNDAAEACTVDWDDFRVEEIDPVTAGMRVGSSTLSALNIGSEPVVAAYLGEEPIPVP